MKQLRQIIFFCLMACVFGCKKPPEYPTTPEISNVKIKKTTIRKMQDGNVEVTQDSVTIVCDFKDGNGDLGTSNTADNNFFVQVLRKVDGKFVDVYDTVYVNNTSVIDRIDKIDKNGTFFPLNPDGREGPIEGTLNYGVSLNFLIFDANEYTLKFIIQIKDNSGNLSNTLETPEVLIKTY